VGLFSILASGGISPQISILGPPDDPRWHDRNAAFFPRSGRFRTLGGANLPTNSSRDATHRRRTGDLSDRGYSIEGLFGDAARSPLAEDASHPPCETGHCAESLPITQFGELAVR
jgi:hypothetical protein